MTGQIKRDPDEKEAATRMALNKIQWRHFQIAEQMFQAWKKREIILAKQKCVQFSNAMV